MPWRFLTLLLALVLYVVLREFQRTPKCPHCTQRAGREWRGQAGYCKACGFIFRV
jgi:tRNA(Ile2) C34 agmatinyltransferase TiaS